MVSQTISEKELFQKVHRLTENKVWHDIPDVKGYRGTGTPGTMLEELLNIDPNNRDSPDMAGWEIKFKRSGSLKSSLMTLFHLDPYPKGITWRMVNKYGILQEDGAKSFRHTINIRTLSGYSKRGFRPISVNDEIKIEHLSGVMDNMPRWEHSDILNAAASKLRRVIVVEGTYNKKERKIRYESGIKMDKFRSSEFIKIITEEGKVMIEWDARSKGEQIATSGQWAGKIRPQKNHGVKFRIKYADLPSLWNNIERL